VKKLHNSQLGADNALNRLFELTVVLGDAMEHGLAARGTTRARAQVISTLHVRGAMRQRELSQVLKCTPRNVTGLLDGLQASGFVTRSPHPTDRRATLVELTERGTAAAAAWYADHRALATDLFDDVRAADLARFVAALDQVIARLRAANLP
jgi:DNA-binding MarR family transcriptional regulator